jgi:hypothetical protein
MKKIQALLSLLFFVSVDVVQANVTVVWSNSGSDVVASYSGTLDLTGYSSGGYFHVNLTDIILGPVNVFRGNVWFGGLTHLSKPYNAFINTGFTTEYHTGIFNGDEQTFGFYSDRDVFSSHLYVTPGYVSGDQIEGRAVFENRRVSVIFGAEAFSSKVFDDGANTITFSAVPEPASGLILLCGLSMLALKRLRSVAYPASGP